MNAWKHRALVGALTGAWAVLLGFGGWLYWSVEQDVAYAAPATTTHLGAEAIQVSDPVAALGDVDPARIVPAPVSAGDDKGGLGGEHCIDGYDSNEPLVCEYGPEGAATHVVVVGDSKMHQWLPAVEHVADARGWRVTTSLKDACPLTRAPTVARGGRPYDECAAVNDARIRDLLTDDTVDLVLTSHRTPRAYLPDASDDTATQALADDLSDLWAQLEAAGKDVVVVLDNPSPPFEVMDCVASRGTNLTGCAFAEGEGDAASGAPTQRLALGQASEVGVVDMSPWICVDGECPPVVGDVLVYRQGTHLTGTYVRTLAPFFDEALAPHLP